jgi:iron complex transport system substrate-binding protein
MTCSSLRLLLRGLTVALLAVAAGCRTETSGTPAADAAKGVAWPRTFSGAGDEAVTLQAPPARIVSLAPAITEALFAVGAGSHLVGRTSFCDFPPEAEALPEVGAYTGFSVEKVLGLRPDLVLGMRGTSKDAVLALRRADVPVLMYDPVTLRGVLDLMGDLCDLTDVAKAPVEKLQGRVAAVEAQAAKLPRHPRVLCAVQIEPLYAAGPRNHIDDMIRLAGGENAAGDAATEWPQYSLERMLEKNPEVILVPRSVRMGTEDGGPGATVRMLQASRAWAQTTAVKRGAIVEIDDDLLTLPGPRIVDGLEQMAEAVGKAAEAAR